MPSWRDLKRFCEHDGWELYKQTNHYYYRKRMRDGTLKRTRVSLGTGEIPRRVWSIILNKQLQVSLEYFNEKKWLSLGEGHFLSTCCGYKSGLSDKGYGHTIEIRISHWRSFIPALLVNYYPAVIPETNPGRRLAAGISPTSEHFKANQYC